MNFSKIVGDESWESSFVRQVFCLCIEWTKKGFPFTGTWHCTARQGATNWHVSPDSPSWHESIRDGKNIRSSQNLPQSRFTKASRDYLSLRHFSELRLSFWQLDFSTRYLFYWPAGWQAAWGEIFILLKLLGALLLTSMLLPLLNPHTIELTYISNISNS